MTQTVHTLAQVQLYAQLTMADVIFFSVCVVCKNMKKMLGKIGENSIVENHFIFELAEAWIDPAMGILN